MSYQIGAYYFPNYHLDPRNEANYGPGWTEWELVRNARPRWPGHAQPRIPQWGYEDEADPAVFARKIDAAANHGLSHFIFDWYWYEEGMFLQRCLEAGYMQAANRDRLKFALMWANHDWVDIMPVKRSQRDAPPLLYHSVRSPEMFDQITDYIVERYFSSPAYWTIDGCPYFSIYELYRLIQAFPNVENLATMLRRFREKTRALGFRDLHLNAVVWGVQVLPGEQTFSNPAEMLARLGFDSVTTYAWIHHVDMPLFPRYPYRDALAQMVSFWNEASVKYGLAYHPNVSMGWDASPRTIASDVYDRAGYPFTSTFQSTPGEFRDALHAAKSFLDTRGANILNINAWNEWTESSYLEPDVSEGLAYLQAIQSTFP